MADGPLTGGKQSEPIAFRDRRLRKVLEIDDRRDDRLSSSLSCGGLFTGLHRRLSAARVSGDDVPTSLRHSSLANIDGLSALMEKKLHRMRHPIATGNAVNKIPTEMKEITKDWAMMITNQYRVSSERPVITVDDVLSFMVSDCKKSVGDFSSTYRIDVSFRNPPDETQGDGRASGVGGGGGGGGTSVTDGSVESCSFIAKLLPSDDSARAYVVEANLLEKEIEFYFELLPSIKQFLRLTSIKRRCLRSSGPGGYEASLLHSTPTFLDGMAPECIFSSHNSDGAAIIVFRSFPPEKFGNVANPEGLCLREVMWIAQAVAFFHASGRAFITRNNVDVVIQRYPYLADDMYSTSSFVKEVCSHLEAYEELLQTALDKLPVAEDDDDAEGLGANGLRREDILAAKKQFSSILEANTWDIIRGFCRYGPDTLTTICHGELWEPNILLPLNEDLPSPTTWRTEDLPERMGDRVKIIDWKNAKICTATLDLAFLMLSSTSFDLRSEFTGEVLKVYHEAFCSQLEYLNPSLSKPSFEQLEDDYLCSLGHAAVQAICMFIQQMYYITSTAESIREQMSDAKNRGDDELVLQLQRKHNNQMKKLRSYETRALNLLRDVELRRLSDMDGD